MNGAPALHHESLDLLPTVLNIWISPTLLPRQKLHVVIFQGVRKLKNVCARINSTATQSRKSVCNSKLQSKTYFLFYKIYRQRFYHFLKTYTFLFSLPPARTLGIQITLKLECSCLAGMCRKIFFGIFNPIYIVSNQFPQARISLRKIICPELWKTQDFYSFSSTYTSILYEIEFLKIMVRSGNNILCIYLLVDQEPNVWEDP